MNGRRAVTYHTLMTEKHEVIFANGLAVETFYPGRQALGLLSPTEQIEMGKAFGAKTVVDADTFGPPARRTLKANAVRAMGHVCGVCLNAGA